MTKNMPSSLSIENLMSHIRVLCEDIGPRPPTSTNEYLAAGYVKKTLVELGYSRIDEQSFKSQDSYGWILIPTALASALGMTLDTPGKRWGKWVGGLLCLGGAHTLLGFTRARFPFFQRWIAQNTSQNIGVTIPSRQHSAREVFLISHLDTQKQRFLAPPPWPKLMKPILTAAIVLTTLGGLSRLSDAVSNHRGKRWWQKLLTIGLWGSVFGVILDELQPHVQGASDNASSVAALLGLADALRTNPLQKTQVTLLFTGCEEPVCVGIENYLRTQRPDRTQTYWLDLDMVGGEHPCYATRHGISYLTEYTPDETLMHLADQTAAQHPELGVVGREMLTLDEVSNLRDHGYAALLITSHGADGWLSHWHRVTDTVENINLDGLTRAAQYTWALLQTLDTEVI